MVDVATVAEDFCKMMLEGRFVEAGQTYWSQDVSSIEPSDLPGGIPARVESKTAALDKLDKWLGASAVGDLRLDGPFVTEDTFAVGMEMTITNRVTSEGRPFREIGIYRVRDGKITEERFFY